MVRKCVLDEDNCLTLELILQIFHCGIKEEHSWALIYQSINSLKQYINIYQNNEHFSLHELFLSHLFIKNNGTIDQKSWKSSGSEVKLKSVVSMIGALIYEALDYGNGSEEEFVLMPSLEHVFNVMIQDIQIDEGIDDQNDANEAQLLDQILEICKNHIFDNRNIEEHYRNVCRALVAEAIELSTFLDQISIGTKDLKNNEQEVDNFQVEVWAHLWMKVMHELRVGVTLKSFDRQEFGERHKREYELTPFEMLLDDINSKRYTLKKVVSLPKKVEKDARNMILQFIRSRPPLKPAKDRQLNPLPSRQLSLHEQLMQNIKKTHSLKPTPPPFRRKFDSFYIPREKAYSTVYPLNIRAISETTKASMNTTEGVSESTIKSLSPFRRLSFNNMSLRSRPTDPNSAINSRSQTRRRSFWGKLCMSFW